MIWEIPRCYDSHTHFLATGLLRKGLRLFDLHSADEVGKLKIEPQHFRGEWLVGFGWDQSKWTQSQLPTKEVLDSFFPNFPVAFSRADGHSVWLNSKALERVGYLNKTEKDKPTPAGGLIIRDGLGHPTGIFSELAKIEVEAMLPPYSSSQEKEFFLEAIRYFNSRGFSHIRDMSGSIGHWNTLREIDLAGQLTLYVEENFACENLEDFARALREAQAARASETPHLKAVGIKFYFDGSLGSDGAYLSQFYPGSRNRGLTLWSLQDVEKVLEKTWRAGFEVCVHTIGDEAAHLILQTARKVSIEKNIRGPLNVEHAEVLRDETLEIMKELPVVCHLQPCHWLTDRKWLREKLGSLYQSAFPWAALEARGIPFQWGSDSPIEEASVADNWQALIESPKAGIPELKGELLKAHTHRRSDWGNRCKSTFVDGRLREIVFDGQELQFAPGI